MPTSGERPQIGLHQRLEPRQELRLKLAPQVIQSIEVLQMPVTELAAYIREQMLENPLLDWAEPHEGEGELPEELAAEYERRKQMEKLEEEGRVARDFERLEELDEYFRQMEEKVERRFGESEDDPKRAMLENTAATVTLQEHLLQQLRIMQLDGNVRRAAEEIIYCLDDDGYFHEELDFIMKECGVDRQTAEQALKVVQSLEPPGVGARNLAECLLLQIGDDPKHNFEKRLIKEHLDDILHNRLPRVAQATGESLERVKEAVEFIRHLNPKPGAVLSGEPAPPVRPDIIMEKVDGEYVVRIEDWDLPPLRISRTYGELLEVARKDPKLRDFLKRKYESARRLILAIEQRRLTLLRIANAIAHLQRDFLERGVEFMRPLRMRDLANRLGVHVSTVSRAIAGKWVQTPHGIYPLRFFFTGAVRKHDGTEGSVRTIRERIKRMIENEDPRNPLSDEEIVRRLSREGFSLARRTVAKYRQQMGIPASRQRKRY